MDVILVKDVDRLGKAGQKVSVKDGFARNYLLPQGLAQSATPGARSQMEALRKSQLRQAEMKKAKAAELSSRLNGISCAVRVAVGAQGKLHGAVTAGDIIKVLKSQGIVLEKHQVALEGPITVLGLTEVSVKLHPEVTAHLKVSVVQE